MITDATIALLPSSICYLNISYCVLLTDAIFDTIPSNLSTLVMYDCDMPCQSPSFFKLTGTSTYSFEWSVDEVALFGMQDVFTVDHIDMEKLPMVAGIKATVVFPL
jgi:hypothetical protein